MTQGVHLDHASCQGVQLLSIRAVVPQLMVLAGGGLTLAGDVQVVEGAAVKVWGGSCVWERAREEA